jgi:hypothetical protein
LRIAFPKFNTRELLLCDCDHFLGKIEAARCCAAFGRGARDISGTTTDVENNHASSNLGSIEKRWSELPGRACSDGVVFAGTALPAFVFKFGECFHHVRRIKKNIDFSLDVLPFSQDGGKLSE